jgi:hypothetical protein
MDIIVTPTHQPEHALESAVQALPFTNLSSDEEEILNHVTTSLLDINRSLDFLASELKRENAPSHLQHSCLQLGRTLAELSNWVHTPKSFVPAESTESQPSPADVARASRADTSPALPARETKMPKVQTDERIVEVTLPPDEKFLLGRRPKKKGKGRAKVIVHITHLSLSQQDLDRLEQLRDRTRTRAAADVVRRALKLYEVVLDAVAKDKDVIFESRSGGVIRERLRL